MDDLNKKLNSEEEIREDNSLTEKEEPVTEETSVEADAFVPEEGYAESEELAAEEGFAEADEFVPEDGSADPEDLAAEEGTAETDSFVSDEFSAAEEEYFAENELFDADEPVAEEGTAEPEEAVTEDEAAQEYETMTDDSADEAEYASDEESVPADEAQDDQDLQPEIAAAAAGQEEMNKMANNRNMSTGNQKSGSGKKTAFEKKQASYQKYLAKKQKKKARPTGVKVLLGFLKGIGIALLVVLGLAFFAAAYAAGTVYQIAETAPEMSVKDVYPTMYPTTVYDASGKKIATLTTDGSNRAEITADEVTDKIRYAVIDIEDERFYEHKGIDPKGIIRAIRTNLESDRSEGASTITQQLIKNAVFEGGMEDTMQERIYRKIREWKLALDLEKKMTKEEILVTYLNTINMGSGVYGIKQAAKYYFNKTVDKLTFSECAVLAAITQNPSANNPFRHPEKNRERQMHVLNKMLELGHITQKQYDKAVEDTDVYDRIQNVVSNHKDAAVYSYFTDSLLKQVLDDFQEQLGCTEEEAEKLLYAGGLTIYATQNPKVQKIVDEEMNDPNNFATSITTYSIIWSMSVQKADGTTANYNQNQLSAYFRETLGQSWYKMDYPTVADAKAAIKAYKKAILKRGDTILAESAIFPIQPQVSFSVMDYTNGQVLAVNGGRDKKKANLTLSRATDTFRQPGSTFKPLASFGPAIDMGRASLETPIVDEPFKYPGTEGKMVRNWWGESYRGMATVRDGIRDSMNIVAVKNLNRIGPENVIPYLQKMGFSTITEQDANLATALGGLTYGVSNLELCAAYGMIANKGVYLEPSFYTKILNYDGSVLLERKPKKTRVFQKYTTDLLTQALIDVVQSGTGTGCSFWTAPLAGKTGTTNDNRDIWFAGFIPKGLCACIWVGQDDNATLWDANIHQAIYSKTMGRIVQLLGKEGGAFPPLTQEIKCICKETGMLATENCKNTEIRFYDFGMGPGVLCTAHPLTGNIYGDKESSSKESTEETWERPTGENPTQPDTRPTQPDTKPTQPDTKPTQPEPPTESDTQEPETPSEPDTQEPETPSEPEGGDGG